MRRAGLASSLLALVMSAPLVAAMHDPAATDPDWGQEPRRLGGNWDSTSFTFTSTRDGSPEDVITVSYDVADQVLRYGYEAADEPGTRQGHGLALGSILEYQDRDGDGHFGLGDPIIQQLDLDDARSARVDVEALDDGRLRATAIHQFPGVNGARFTLSVLMTPTRDAPEGALLDPVDAAIDIDLERFPFESDNATALALEMRWMERLDRDDHELRTTQAGLRFSHQWTPQGTVVGSAAPLGLTVQSYGSDDAVQTVLWASLPAGESWHAEATVGLQRLAEPDPEIPEILLDDIRGRWHLYLLGIVLAGLLVGLPLSWRKDE